MVVDEQELDLWIQDTTDRLQQVSNMCALSHHLLIAVQASIVSGLADRVAGMALSQRSPAFDKAAEKLNAEIVKMQEFLKDRTQDEASIAALYSLVEASVGVVNAAEKTNTSGEIL